MGVVVREDDPLATAGTARVDDLNGRRWVRLPRNADASWVAYWTGPSATEAQPAQGTQELRTIQACLQAVLWNHMSALAPVDQALPLGLVVIPAEDRAPSEVLLAWRADDNGPLIRTLAALASRLTDVNRTD